MNRTKIVIGLIGAGRIGKMHAENIKKYIPEAEIRAVADLCADQIKPWAESISIPFVTAKASEIFNNPEINAVLICSSTDSHVELIIEAARAGKHVFCEKPVGISAEKVKVALNAVREAGVKLQVGFNRRFDHNHKSVKEAVAAGKIGEPHLVLISSRDPEPPPLEFVGASGGLFLDMTIHDFDMARFLAGSEVVEVFAAGAVLVDPAIGEAGDIDTAVVTLKFANGAIGIINNSRKAAYGYDQRVEVFGSRGSAADFNDTPSTTVICTAGGIQSEKPLYFFRERYKQSFIEEMKEFIDAVLKDKEPPMSGDESLYSLLIAVAAKESLEKNRPVKVSY